MNPTKNLPPFPPVPIGFDRWEYRGPFWKPGRECVWTVFDELEGWIIDDDPTPSEPFGGSEHPYIEAVRGDQPTGVEARVCQDIAARQRLGIAKYGCTVEQSSDDMLRHAICEAYDLSVYLRAEWERRQWQPIKTAPRDGTQILVYCPPTHGLNHMASICAWHEDAGFCVDELREPTHWLPLPAPPAASQLSNNS